MRHCGKCKTMKPILEFHTNQYWCKSCRTEYSKNHMSKVMQLPAKYEKYAHQLTISEKPSSLNGKLTCKCFKCENEFLPRLVDVIERIRALNGKLKTRKGNQSYAENHLYCSEECKHECDAYKQRIRYKHQIPLHTKARCNQHTNKKALLDSQIDKYGYTFCEKCGSKTEKLAIHHNIMVSKDFTEADNVAHQILVCDNCHIHEDC